MTVKEQIIDYRNQHKESRALLGVVLGEFERLEKSPKRLVREITNEEAVGIIKKLIQSNNECNVLGENEILELFIPKQLTEGQISDIILHLNASSIKECMDHFKSKYAGRYDGKLVSKLYKEINA